MSNLNRGPTSSDRCSVQGTAPRASSEADERRAQAGGTLVSTNRLAVTFNAVDLTGGPRGRPV